MPPVEKAVPDRRSRRSAFSEPALLRLAGGLSVGGFLLFTVITMAWHPSGEENNHPVIFTKYAESDPWIATHFGQFVAVLLALGGFLVLYRVFVVRGDAPVLATFALVATAAATAVWAALQAVDGVALKHAVDTWIEASGPARSSRFADAESLRWTEWALQSYFRLLLGLAFVLFGIAIVRTGLVARWLGIVGAVGGLVYAGIGIAVGYSGFEKPGAVVVNLLFLTFTVGLLVEGFRRKDAVEPAAA